MSLIHHQSKLSSHRCHHLHSTTRKSLRRQSRQIVQQTSLQLGMLLPMSLAGSARSPTFGQNLGRRRPRRQTKRLPNQRPHPQILLSFAKPRQKLRMIAFRTFLSPDGLVPAPRLVLLHMPLHHCTSPCRFLFRLEALWQLWHPLSLRCLGTEASPLQWDMSSKRGNRGTWWIRHFPDFANNHCKSLSPANCLPQCQCGTWRFLARSVCLTGVSDKGIKYFMARTCSCRSPSKFEPNSFLALCFCTRHLALPDI